MPVKVYNSATQQVVEVDAAEAQRGIQRGEYQPTGEVRVAKGNRTGRVAAGDVLTALGQGAEIVDDAGAAEVQMRREEESLGGQIQGGAEALAAGATLGLSTAALDALGADPERMKARRDVLGKGGTALEIIGSAIPSVLSGGTSLGATAGATAARAGGRGLAATVLRNTPAGLAARLGTRTGEAVALRSGTGVASRILPSGAREFVEGAAAGVGAEIDESVLGEREITADRLAASGLLGGVFGGTAGVAVPGLAKVALGAAKAPIKGMQGVLGRLNSSSGGMATREAAEAVVRESGELSTPARLWRDNAIRQGIDGETANRLARLGDSAEGRSVITSIERDAPRINREAAELVTTKVNGLHTELREVQRLATGEGKVANWERLVPSSPEALRAAKYASDDLLVKAKNGIDDVIRQNDDDLLRYKASTHSGPMLKQAESAIGRLHLDIVEAEKLVGKSKIARTAAAVDNYKRRLGSIVEENGGWGSMRMATPEMRATNMHIRKMYGEAKDHLEREDIWGAAAGSQREINAAYTAMAQADDLFEQATKGSGLASVVDADGVINADKALRLIRAHGRVGGDVTVTRLMDAMRARANYVKTIGKHIEADDAAKARISKVESNVEELDREFKRQAKNAGILDDLKTARGVEGAGSPSLLTTGTSLASIMGFGIGGLPGAVAGAAITAARQPYLTLRRYAAMREALDKADLRLTKALSGMFDGKPSGIKLSLPKVNLPHAPVGMVAGKAGAGQADRDKRRETAIAKAVELSSSPEALERALAVTMTDVHEVAPGVAGVMQQRLQVAAHFLASKAPHTYSRPFSKTKLVDPVSAASFERYLEAVTDPIGALERFAEGRITQETAEAIRIVYPALWADVQRRVVDRLSEGGEMPYAQRVRLGMLFQVPSDPSLRGPIANEIQMAIGAGLDEPTAAEAMQGANAPKPSAKAGTIKTDTNKLQTASERASSWRTMT